MTILKILWTKRSNTFGLEGKNNDGGVIKGLKQWYCQKFHFASFKHVPSVTLLTSSRFCQPLEIIKNHFKWFLFDLAKKYRISTRFTNLIRSIQFDKSLAKIMNNGNDSNCVIKIQKNCNLNIIRISTFHRDRRVCTKMKPQVYICKKSQKFGFKIQFWIKN